MGHQVIRQPDGKLAVFSSGTDSWIVTNATAEDLGNYYAARAAEDARRSALETAAHVLAGEARRVYCQFVLPFEEANRESREHGGDWWQDGEWQRP
jgi:hypothetical protein